MSESKETLFQPPQKRLRQGTKVLLLGLALGSCVMFTAFLIASIAVSYPDEFVALCHWMQRTSIGWFVWRLTLYSVLGWGFWKIWHAPGCKPEYRASLKRMGIVSVMFLFACEYAMYFDTGTMR